MSKHIDWHHGFFCALKHDLRDYADILLYEKEHSIGNNYFRIDLLVIRRLPGREISKALAKDFREINIFENKGIGDSVSISSYYKVIGYCGLYLDSTWQTPHTDSSPPEDTPVKCTAQNITINFLSRSKPVKLIRHLKDDRHKPIEKIAPGIYDVGEETFLTRIIVTKELTTDEYLYLRCLGIDLEESTSKTISRLACDIREHSSEQSYLDYSDLITRANSSRKGDIAMANVSEGLLEWFGTSSEQIRKEQLEKDSVLIDAEKKRADRYRSLLIKHGIDPEDDEGH